MRFHTKMGWVGMVLLLLGCDRAAVSSYPENLTGPSYPLDVRQEIQALVSVETQADAAMGEFRDEIRAAEVQDVLPDFEAIEERVTEVLRIQQAFGERVDPMRRKGLRETFKNIHRRYRGRVLEIRGQKLAFLLGQWRDLLSELKDVSGQSLEDEGVVTGGEQPPSEEELGRIKERLAQDLADHVELAGVQLQAVEEMAADPLLSRRLYVGEVATLEELAALAESDPQFSALVAVKSQMMDLGRDYYFTLGAMEYLDSVQKTQSQQTVDSWRVRVTALAEKLSLTVPLSSIQTLADLFVF